MISQTYIQNRGYEASEPAEKLTLAILEEIMKITNRLIDDPDYDFSDRWERFIDKQNELYRIDQIAAISTYSARAYKKSINSVDGDLNRILTTPKPADKALPISQVFAIGGTSKVNDKAREILKDFPKHFRAAESIMASAIDDVEGMISPIFRAERDIIRRVQIQTFTNAFRQAEIPSRVDIMQDLLDDFSKNGITAVRYRNGAQMPVDNYTRMISRSVIQRSVNQASLNRLAERGYDLVRINQYAGASSLCSPWQGGIYSISGSSDKYQPLSNAIFNGKTGIYHPNCGHSQSAYIPGVSEPLGKLSTDKYEEKILNEMGEAKGNRFIYQQRQRQRAIERNIRKYKKRAASSLRKEDRLKANRFVKKWQAEQRNHLDKYKFLRRRYDAEQI